MKVYYAIIDESGSTASTETSHFLVVAALVTEEPVAIRRIIHRLQKKNRSSFFYIR
jgi:hypothetical protein